MANLVDVTDLERITDVEDHVFELYTSRAPREHQHLGYVNRSSEKIEISLKNGIDLSIRQSLTNLSSSKETSTTGFLCWQASVLFVNWVLSDEKCPLYQVFQEKSELSIVELGAGIGGICSSALGPHVSSYIATDQKHILKLLKHNTAENFGTTRFVSSTITHEEGTKDKSKAKYKNTPPQIEVIEYDWEYPEHGWHNYSLVSSKKPDLIIACDTVYNEYLIPYFVSAIKSFMTESSGAFIALQLREEEILETFVSTLLDENLKVFCIPEYMLSEDLYRGFVIYYITMGV